MPESAEVKLTTEFLNKTLSNRIITKWEFISGQYHSLDPEGFDEFYDSLPLLVEEVSCKGKFIYIKCFNEFKRFYILHSLRLTGSWRNTQDAYSRWYIELDNNQKVWFRDTRCLATLQFTSDEKVLSDYIYKLGPDILSEEFTLSIWKKITAEHKNKNITSFLMDQQIISGIGNYIKAEVLYYAKISPLRKVGSLNEQESDQLFEAVRIIPRLAYMNQGCSLKDYAKPNGKTGFQEFHLKIYGKSTATKTKTPDGRTTYWDEKVQV
jgi:DNA-formamidopyrimidine glycosylase